MARLRELGNAVEDTPQQDQDAPAPEATAANAEPSRQTDPQAATPEATDGAQSPRKGRGGRPAGKKAAAADKGRGSGARAATKAPAKKATKKAAPPAQRSAPAAEHDEPVVRSVDTSSAERVGLYLDPDDYKALLYAKIDDGANANARIRAMIALWRSNPRFRNQVDRLAQTARRGGL